jgi:EAL domain-containing protein (putative c-di-GMP-specific phosphodiesterase class I)
VENERQATSLTAMKCDLAEGFLFLEHFIAGA